MAEMKQKDASFPEDAPPPYITNQQQAINNSDTIISLPEIIVNNPEDEAKGTAPLVDNFVFNDKQIRQGFIRKVYSLIMVQLMITGAVIAWFMNDLNLQYAVHENIRLFFGVTMGVYFTSMICIICCEGPRRKVPYNYIFLLMFTLALSFIVGMFTTLFRFQEIIIAGGITFAIVLALTIFAFQTKIDFTLMTGWLLSIFLVFLLFGIALIWAPFPAARIIYSSIGVLIMCLYLVYDTQMMIGGKHRYAISPEEYVFAALTIYVDIMYIFVRILRLMR